MRHHTHQSRFSSSSLALLSRSLLRFLALTTILLYGVDLLLGTWDSHCHYHPSLSHNDISTARFVASASKVDAFMNTLKQMTKRATAGDSVPHVQLNDGHSMPQLGFGTYQISDPSVLEKAAEVGYRHFDTAQFYANEEALGKALANVASSKSTPRVPREEVFITSKVWDSHHGFKAAKAAVDESLSKLRTSFLDLYLIHWPAPKKDMYVDTWGGLIEAKKEGKIKSIGVSNFLPEHNDRLIRETGVTPAVNQIEMHPFFQQRELAKYNADHNIATGSWSPLALRVDRLQAIPAIADMAKKHDRSAAQVVLRWHAQKGYTLIPKSETPSRMEQNFNIFDFTLDEKEMKAIDALNDIKNGRIGADPHTFSSS